METYHQEVTRKRRAARIFWSIVFFFATCLYFFFQGYYPSIDFSFKEFFQSGNVRKPEVSEFVKSFGIINIAVTPEDATILLSGSAYAHNEKRMVNYGTYSLFVGKTGYIHDSLDFMIDKETPYYIDTITLLPRPSYEKIGTGLTDIIRMSETSWGATSASGMIIMNASLSGGVVIGSGGLRYLGEGYFLSGSRLVEYDEGQSLWQTKTWSGAENFLKKCPSSARVSRGKILCEGNHTLLTEKGKMLSGVTLVGEGFIQTKGALLIGDTPTLLTLSGAEEQMQFFTKREDIWYGNSRGSLIPLKNQIQKSTPPIEIDTGLDTIKHILTQGETLYIWGTKGKDTALALVHHEGKGTPEILPFPDIALEDIRIDHSKGNTFIKTRGALLFLYHNSRSLSWIVEGDILAFSEEAVIYKKDGVLWRGTWDKVE